MDDPVAVPMGAEVTVKVPADATYYILAKDATDVFVTAGGTYATFEMNAEKNLTTELGAAKKYHQVDVSNLITNPTFTGLSQVTLSAEATIGADDKVDGADGKVYMEEEKTLTVTFTAGGSGQTSSAVVADLADTATGATTTKATLLDNGAEGTGLKNASFIVTIAQNGTSANVKVQFTLAAT